MNSKKWCKVLKIGIFPVCLLISLLIIPFSIEACIYPIVWSPTKIEQTMNSEEQKDLTVTFTSNLSLRNVDLRVVPALQSFVKIEPNHFETITPKTSYQVTLHIFMPFGTQPKLYDGTIYLKVGSHAYSNVLKLLLNTAPRVTNRVSAKIAATKGGTITVTEPESIYSDGFELIIPPMALPRDTTIAIGDVTSRIPLPPTNMNPVGIPISIEPNRLVLKKPATIKIPYSDEKLLYAGVSSLDYLTLKTFNDYTGKWEDVPIKEIDTDNKYIIAELNHFSWYNPFSWGENPKDEDPATDEKIIDYVQNVWKVAQTSDDIRIVLSMKNSLSSIPFKSEIGGVLTTIDMMQDMNNKDYASAAKTGVKWLIRFGLKEAGYTWLSAYTGFAFATYDSLMWFAKGADEIAFNLQIKWYVEWRDVFTRDEIVSNSCGCLTNDGWLANPGVYPVGRPKVTGKYVPEDVYKAGEAAWLARHSNQYRNQNETEIKNAFIQALNNLKNSSQPKASFTISPTNTGNPPLTLNFDASSSEAKSSFNIVRYLWNFGNGKHAEGKEVSNTFNAPGTYSVKLTVYDSNNNSSSVSNNVYVTLRSTDNQTPIANFTYQVDSTDHFNINFDASSSSDPDGNIVQYRWSFGDGSIAYGISTSHTYEEEGIYTVQLRVTDNKLNSTLITKDVSVAQSCSPTILNPNFINGGAESTTSSTVNVNVTAKDACGLTGYQIGCINVVRTCDWEEDDPPEPRPLSPCEIQCALNKKICPNPNDFITCPDSIPIIPSVNEYNLSIMVDSYPCETPQNIDGVNTMISVGLSFFDAQGNIEYFTDSIKYEGTSTIINPNPFIYTNCWVGNYDISGSDFTPCGAATFHFQKYDDAAHYTYERNVNGYGGIYQFPSDGKLSNLLPPGSYACWAIDEASGMKSNEVEVIIKNDTINPTIAQTPMSGPPGTTFIEWGTGFTPCGFAALHFRKPDGTEYPSFLQQLDPIGHFEISYTAPMDKPLGTYTWWAIDTGIKSNEVSYEITSGDGGGYGEVAP